MTPNEILAFAQNQFSPLYYNDPERLSEMLTRALGVYQDIAGVVSSVSTPDGTLDTTVALPADFLECVGATDANGRYHEFAASDTLLSVRTSTDSLPPFTWYYMVNLRDYDRSKNLPNGIVSLITDYLITLIEIPNTDRARAVALATGRQIELPSNDDLFNRRLTIEQQMEDSQAMMPMFSVY